MVVDGGAVLAGGVGDVADRHPEAVRQEQLLGDVEQLRLRARGRGPIGLQAGHGCTLPVARAKVQTLFESSRGSDTMAELRFDGKAAIVTGGGRGLGRAYARLLGGAGVPGAGERPRGHHPGRARIRGRGRAGGRGDPRRRRAGGRRPQQRRRRRRRHRRARARRVRAPRRRGQQRRHLRGRRVRRDAGRRLRPPRRHALRRRGAGEPRRVAAPQAVGRGPHREHVVGVGVRHPVHQPLRVEQGRHLRLDPCARRRGRILRHRRERGHAGGATRG